MSDTNSFNSQELTADPPQSIGDTKPNVHDAANKALLERLGVGGMGEVYRFGDEALQRDLAIKILKSELRGNADAEERFLREARLTGSLQHPGIVPIHSLSRLADGRPCYTMKLVRGRTFADMLRDEPEGPERLPRLLAILEKVCQAVAYAHSKHVIHRDLKPSNVMVGEFGEVQVMDWGLAKELSRNEPEPPPDATEDVETAAWTNEGEGLSRAGLALGTPAYMPPEQAAGDWDIVDERADVFALGAILCEMLTGHPPYHGANRDELLRRARRGDLAEALGRLAKCGADAALVDLCRECLAAERLQRPRHAGVVSERLASYQAEVRERLRQAELQRARAEVKALEERKRRRLIAALALSALVLIAGGVAAWWQWQQRRAKADGAVALALGEVRSLLKQARSNVLSAAGYDKTVAAAHNAVEIASAGGASENMQRQAVELFAEVEQESEAAAKDRRLLAALLEVHGPHEGPKYRSDDKGAMMAMAEPTAEEQFASAFRDWGLDVDVTPIAEAATLLKKRPAAVVTEVIAALDEWTSQLRQHRKTEAAERVAELASALDDKPGSLRRELREILSRRQLPVERALSAMSAALRPVPIPIEVPLGKDRLRLRQLAEKTNPANESTLGLLTLTHALRVAGEEAFAELLLRAAVRARPQEVVLYHTLGRLLTTLKPPRWGEAVVFYQAARSLRPDFGVSLAYALMNSGQAQEGVDLLTQMVQESPRKPYLYLELSWGLNAQRKHVEAAAACRKAIELSPNDAAAYEKLASSLFQSGKHVDAEAACRKAIALKPDYARPYLDLGIILEQNRKYVEAETAYRKAIELHPTFNLVPWLLLGELLHRQRKFADAEAVYRKAIELELRAGGSALMYTFLAEILSEQEKHVEAEAVCRNAIALQPDSHIAYHGLGNVLRHQGKLVEAEAAHRKAIALKSDYAEAHCDLGELLQQQGRFDEALASRRRGHELGSKKLGWPYPSAQWVRDAERMLVLDKKLPAILSGAAMPANPGEAIVLASMCQQPYKKCHAASARLYADAFAAEPKLAARNRYNAACSAALAAAAQGEDARLLPDKAAVMFRRWALGWLRDDLNAYAKLSERNDPKANQFIRQTLAHWRRDPDLASVRDPRALDRLPDNERAAWHALWRDVDELAKQVAKADQTEAAQKKAKP